MTGIQYITDENGKRISVVIDLHAHGELWEDFHDRLLAEERKSEPRESLEAVKQKLSAKKSTKRH